MQVEGRLVPTRCAVCGTSENARELFAANFSPRDFNADVFSARRLPDKIHYRIVQCRTCGLVRSDPMLEPGALEKLYQASRQTYDAEVANLAETYGRYLARLGRYQPRKGRLLEIGCGSGFVLERAVHMGYADAVGVEPSQEAVAKAPPEIRARLVCDIFRPGLFAAQSFDVICMFQVFDHIPDPDQVLAECCRLLKPGGLILLLNHDAASPSARLLGESSPIFDIEHTYLYSRKTLTRLLAGFPLEVKESGSATNTYSLRYLAHLFPLPKSFKQALLGRLASRRLGEWKLSVPLGNLYFIARKKAETLNRQGENRDA